MIKYLNDDIFLYMIDFLDLRSIINMSKVSNKYYSLIKDNYFMIVKMIFHNLKIKIIHYDNYLTFKKEKYACSIFREMIKFDDSEHINEVINK